MVLAVNDAALGPTTTSRGDEATARLPQAESELDAATQPEQITRIIVLGDARIPVTTYQRAWSKLVAVGALQPTHGDSSFWFLS